MWRRMPEETCVVDEGMAEALREAALKRALDLLGLDPPPAEAGGKEEPPEGG